MASRPSRTNRSALGDSMTNFPPFPLGNLVDDGSKVLADLVHLSTEMVLDGLTSFTDKPFRARRLDDELPRRQEVFRGSLQVHVVKSGKAGQVQCHEVTAHGELFRGTSVIERHFFASVRLGDLGWLGPARYSQTWIACRHQKHADTAAHRNEPGP